MGIINIDVDFSKFKSLKSITDWFDLNGRRCRFLHTDSLLDGTRLGRFEYEDGEKFTITHRPLYGMKYDSDEHKAIEWDSLKGWSICKS